MLSKKNRISNQRLITKLNNRGKTYKTRHFVFKFLPSHSEDSKFASIVSKKISNKAVKRNHLRRQIAESIRLEPQKKSPIVCLVIMKKGSPDKIDYNIIDLQIKEFFNQLPINV